MRIGAIVHMYPPNHNAGAEHMLHAMLLHAVKRGHEAIVVVDPSYVGHKKPKPYVLDGVRVVSDKRSLRGIDILLTHLDLTPDAEKYAAKHKIPLAHIFHNDSAPLLAKKCDLAIYNSHWVLKKAPVDAPSIVLHPPIWPERYRVPNKGKCITLINLQKPKGVHMFYHLARVMPEYHFLGVRGSYGMQEPPPRLSNLAVIDNQIDIRKVYAQTRILLMPSSYESYGRCAIEAAVSGIPTIAHPTPGLREALGEGGWFPLPDSDSWACAIRFVDEKYDMCSSLALNQASSLDPEGDMDRCLDALAETVKGY